MRWASLSFVMAAGVASAQMNPPCMPISPDIHGDQVVFCAEGDLWLGSISAGTAKRLTAWPGMESNPKFSPDGTKIAFSADFDGPLNVYQIAVENGGLPERLTFDPFAAQMVDWSSDGKSILYVSGSYHPMANPRLCTLSLSGGRPKVLPMPSAGFGAWLPGGEVVYTRARPAQNNWDRYRGGQANDIFIGNLSTNSFNTIVKTEFNEEWPTPCAGLIYFVSEVNGSANLYAVDQKSGRTQQVTQHKGIDVEFPSSDGKRVIYSLGGDLFVYDPGSKKNSRLTLRFSSDRIHMRPFEEAGDVSEFAPSASGKRVLVVGRGQLFSAPATSGDVRPILAKPGVEVRLPTWSPNGKVVAFVSDESDEWNIWAAPADGSAPAKQLSNFQKLPLNKVQWAPNSMWLAALDESGTLWKVEFGTGKATKIAENSVTGVLTFSISPDSQYVVYSAGKNLNSTSLFLTNLAENKTIELTSGPFVDYNPVFDRSSRWIYWLSDRHVTQRWDTFDFNMRGDDPTVVMAMCIAKDTPNPFLEAVDEEGAKEAGETNPAIVYDFETAAQTYLKLPIKPGRKQELTATSGKLFWLDEGGLQMFDMKSKKARVVSDRVSSYSLSPDGKQMVVSDGDSLYVVEPGEGPGTTAVPLRGWTVAVDPAKEWRQILRSGWRHIRDTFYDPNLHGTDWNAVWSKLEAKLPTVAHRSELTRLISAMQSEVNVSHMYAGGGQMRLKAPAQAGSRGFLGAELNWDMGANAWKIARLYESDGFDLDYRSPLLAPGLGIKNGHYLLQIDGIKLDGESDIFKLLFNKGGKLIRVTTSEKATGEGAKTQWIRAMSGGSIATAQYYDWTGRNRRAVESASGGKFGYIHVPEMGSLGMTEFTKHFYNALDKDAIVIDVRYNGGGITSGLILERLQRVIFEYDQGRYGAPVPYHRMGFLPQVVVLCNEDTASDGEYFCTGFRYMKLGTTVGTRTWGGFVAVGGISTVDGGFISCPVQGSFTPDGKWLPDGYGFKPDIEVAEDVAAFMQGRDNQLERAIAVAQEMVRKNPPKRPGRMIPPKKP